ncbi:cobalamin biosynthesis protein [Patescibacteria group bacterium]|nr:cobalamin biosynthesis protein [Patescibacteria group bacterium]
MITKVAIIAITDEGKKTAKILLKYFKKGKFYFSTEHGRLKDLTGDIFNQFDGLIFIMSLGIVVRIIAPFLKNKHIDPAVVVIDEGKRFAISTISGHEGGANELAIKVANILGAEPVITTASESKKKIVIGIGARRGIKKEEIINAVKYALTSVKCSINEVRCIATIDLKQNETGLKTACLELGVPLRIVSSELIKNFTGKYNRSSLVKEKIGVEGVCEPCGLIVARNPKLILPKTKLGRVTVAVVREN